MIFFFQQRARLSQKEKWRSTKKNQIDKYPSISTPLPVWFDRAEKYRSGEAARVESRIEFEKERAQVEDVVRHEVGSVFCPVQAVL